MPLAPPAAAVRRCRPRDRVHRSPGRAAGAAALAWASAWAAPLQAQTAPAATPLGACAVIGASADRLACYDRLAGRAAEPPVTPTAAATAPAAPASGATPTTTLAPRDTSQSQTPELPDARGASLLSKFWELEPSTRRGVFNFTGYRPNYVLPAHATTDINRAPRSPTQQAVTTPDYRRIEGKIQLSLRTKLAQGLLVDGLDLWGGFTQQSLWQVYNSTDSKPFRNTDYEPEVMLVAPTPEPLRGLPFGWRWRYLQLALAHQSNGQSDPLSRSWNRVYLGTGFERGDMSLIVNLQRRLHEDLEDDNNPDLLDYRGRGDFQLNWTPGPATASLTWRSTFKRWNRGSLQFEWTYPVYRNQPNGLRWYAQAFTGYAETLTDYNFRQTSIGAGLTFLQF